MKKERADVLLVERGLVETREKAKRTIMAGLVYCQETRIDKPGEKIAVDRPLWIKGNLMPYVSRGGYKLAKALKSFQINLNDKRMVDIGSSTGGFSDCALQNGASLVYAVDVGTNQLSWKIRSDERVVVMEKTNFRYSKPEDFNEGLPDFASIDVSFISLIIILPVLKTILKPFGDCVCLVKPQFEAGREQVGKNGIVRDQAIHQAVLEKIATFALSLGYSLKGATHSPITGGDGNIEFLFHLHLDGLGEREIKESFQEIVHSAHIELKKRKCENELL